MYFKKNVSWILLGLSCILVFSMNASFVYAGEVNSAEQQVISAASGTFTYEGEQYRAYPEYVAQLTSYFARDDVNLEQSDVSGLINDMNASIKDGITSGYLYKIESNKKEDKKDKSDDSQNQEDEEDDDTSVSNKTEEKHTDKKFDIKQSVDDGKIFYESDDGNTSVDMVIKNTGYNISGIVYIGYAVVGLAMIIILGFVYCLYFAPKHES